MSSALPELPHLARHALSATVELARLAPETRIRSRDLAERIGVPAPVLAKVLSALAGAGLVDGVKGHHGGYRLARAPDSIRLIEVVGAVTGETGGSVRPQCALGVRKCNPQQPCALHDAWLKAITPLQRLLNRSTVADVVGDTRGGLPGDRA